MSLYKVANPATGQIEAEYPTATGPEIGNALASADAAHTALKNLDATTRAKLLTRVAELHAERRDELAAIATREMGKPISQARREVDTVVSIYRYYSENGPGFLEEEKIEVAAGGTAVVRKEGMGALLGVMPWNFPYYQVARFVAPNLMLGNPILLKPAPQCPESALAMLAIFRDAGAPEGVYVPVFATNEQVAEIIADPRVQGVSLTGSERAGAAIAEIAGRHLKKVVLELGGSDPFIVLDAQDMDALVARAVAGRMVNGGQACNAAKRFVVLDEVYGEFVAKFTRALRQITPSDPLDPATILGPLSSQAAAETLQAQFDAAVADGATVLLEGGRPTEDSAFFSPAVLGGVGPGMDVYRQELFGPIAMVFRASSEAEAVAIANDTSFGLGASVHSDDADRAARVAGQLAAGMVSINECGGTAAELPFGGIKRSGFGRELGRYGLEEFANLKLVRAPA